MKALDLFAGHGWGVACQALAIEEYGVEIMPEAVATRAANGMRTIFNDVWDGLLHPTVYMPPSYNALIASPPCQTFSVAGKGSGRAALDTVVGLIERIEEGMTAHELRYGLHLEDDRTALVLTPLLYALRDKPQYIAWEQVPSVLPVWERCAEALRAHGYFVATGAINSEQYGVPQTRRRAILLASLSGEVKLPIPTHSRYYARDPERRDVGVNDWVSLGSALGWEHGPDWVFNRPSTTVVGSFSPHTIAAPGYRKKGGYSRQNQPGSVNVTIQEAGLIQTYPADFIFCGSESKQRLQIGNAVPPKMAEAILKTFLD